MKENEKIISIIENLCYNGGQKLRALHRAPSDAVREPVKIRKKETLLL